MKNAIQHLSLLGLVATLTTIANARLSGAEHGTKSTVTTSSAQALTGKILSVDKVRTTLSVDIKGSIFAFKLNPQISIFCNGQRSNLDSLSTGQEVSLVTRRAASGRFEIVSLLLEDSAARTEIAGAAATGTNTKSKSSDRN